MNEDEKKVQDALGLSKWWIAAVNTNFVGTKNRPNRLRVYDIYAPTSLGAIEIAKKRYLKEFGNVVREDQVKICYCREIDIKLIRRR